jgi:cyclophilin family peptidyl-prolyl cis-trans isomerase
MASPKRERQREAAAKRREAQAEQRKRDARRRSVLRTVGLVGAALALAALFSFVINRDDDKSSDVASDTSASTESSQDGSDQTSSVSSSALSGRTISGETPCPKADGSEERVAAFEKAPPMCIDVAKTYTATISTTEGDYTAVLDAKAAPKTVNNFVVLARYHFYDGVIFHRIVTDFMNQTGDPLGTGAGGPGYEFDDELPTGDKPYSEGTLAMANSGPNTNGSQFFTMATDYDLPPNYSVFGKVTEGIDVVKAINALGGSDQAGTPTKSVSITSVTISET